MVSELGLSSQSGRTCRQLFCSWRFMTSVWGQRSMRHAQRRWQPRVLVIWQDDRQRGSLCVCVCVFGVDQEEITPAKVGEAAVPSVIRRDCRPHGRRVAQCPAAVRPLIHNLLHQLMGLWKRCPCKAPPPTPRYEIRRVWIFLCVRGRKREVPCNRRLVALFFMSEKEDA